MRDLFRSVTRSASFSVLRCFSGSGRRSRSVAMVAIVALVAGCSGSKSMPDWFGSDSKSGARGEEVFFAGVAGLPVLAEPKGSSAVRGHLALHQKVIRTKLQSGYARVRAAKGGLEGWVLNSRLLWKLPASGAATSSAVPAGGEAAVPAEGTATSVPAEAASAPEEVAAPIEEVPVAEVPTPVEAPPAPPRPAKKSGGASVFDPY